MRRVEEAAEGTEPVLLMGKEGKVALESALCSWASQFLCVCVYEQIKVCIFPPGLKHILSWGAGMNMQ